jgi:hypothetical protein
MTFSREGAMTRKHTVVFAILFCSLFLASLFAQEWKYVGVIISDASRGESAIVVKVDAPIAEGRGILIESRDGTLRDVYRVQHVYENTIVLDKNLREPFVSGARIYQ